MEDIPACRASNRGLRTTSLALVAALAATSGAEASPTASVTGRRCWAAEEATPRARSRARGSRCHARRRSTRPRGTPSSTSSSAPTRASGPTPTRLACSTDRLGPVRGRRRPAAVGTPSSCRGRPRRRPGRDPRSVVHAPMLLEAFSPPSKARLGPPFRPRRPSAPEPPARSERDSTRRERRGPGEAALRPGRRGPGGRRRGGRRTKGLMAGGGSWTMPAGTGTRAPGSLTTGVGCERLRGVRGPGSARGPASHGNRRGIQPPPGPAPAGVPAPGRAGRGPLATAAEKRGRSEGCERRPRGGTSPQ